MKSVAYGVSLFGITFLTLMIVITITTTSQMETAVSRNLSGTLSSALARASYVGKDEDALVEDIISSILMDSNDNVSTDINIKAVDIENGIVSVSVTQEYTKLNGNVGKVTCEKCVVIEDNNALNETYTVNYQTEGFNYAIYKLSGGNMPKPNDPLIEGLTFKYWTLNGERVSPETLPLDKDYTFVAVFE